jgi:hypothetical protein
MKQFVAMSHSGALERHSVFLPLFFSAKICFTGHQMMHCIRARLIATQLAGASREPQQHRLKWLCEAFRGRRSVNLSNREIWTREMALIGCAFISYTLRQVQ